MTTTTTYHKPDSTRTSEDRRTIIMRWMRPDAPTFGEEGAVRAVEVTVSHDKTRHQYRVRMGLIDVTGAWFTAEIHPGNFLTLHTETCARFSRKTLDDLARQTRVMILPDVVAHDPRAASLFAGIPFDA